MNASEKGLRLLAVLLVLLASLAPAATARPDAPLSDELPLGNRGLEETRTTLPVAPGLTYTRIERGEESRRDFFTVDVAFEERRRAAQGVARQLEEDGYDPRVEKISDRAPDDPRRGPLGYLVRTGSFDTQAEADALVAELTAKGYAEPIAVYTGEDGGRTTGPWVVHVLKVNPDRFAGEAAPSSRTGGSSAGSY